MSETLRSAAYQIEGGVDAGGRGPTVWDEFFADRPELVDGKQACNSYNQWRDDVDLLKSYGATAYRFSIAWSRIIPLGGKDDPVNEEGVKFYNDLVSPALLCNDM